MGHDNDGSAMLFEKILASFPEARYCLVITRGLYYRKSLLASIIKLLKEASWLFLVWRFWELTKYRIRRESLRQKALRLEVPVLYTYDINSQETCSEIQQFEPDLLISLYTMQIYEAPVLKIAQYGSISCHPSILPHYRGLEVFFWVLANEEKETGVSVFFLDEKIDAGPVLEQQVVEITAEMTARSIYQTITEIGADLLVRAVRDIDGGTVEFISSVGTGSYYRMPDRDAVRRFRSLGRKFF